MLVSLASFGQGLKPIPLYPYLDLVDSSGMNYTVLMDTISADNLEDSIISIRITRADSTIQLQGVLFYAPGRGDAELYPFSNLDQLKNAFIKMQLNGLNPGDRFLIKQLRDLSGTRRYPQIRFSVDKRY